MIFNSPLLTIYFQFILKTLHHTQLLIIKVIGRIYDNSGRWQKSVRRLNF